MYTVNTIKRIFAGRTGETGLRKIAIDCTAWTGAYPDLAVVLLIIRPGETSSYQPSDVSMTNGILTWIPDTTDTERSGYGLLMLQGIDASGNVIKSASAATEIEPSFGISVSIASAGPAAVVTVADSLAMPLVGLKAAITAGQEGTGDPGPENARAITGWTGANIYVAPTSSSNDPTVSVSWASDPGTVYGGVLDVLAGTLTVTHVKIAVSDDTVIAQAPSEGANGNRFGFQLKNVLAKERTADILCNIGVGSQNVINGSSSTWVPYTCCVYKGTPYSYFRYVLPTTVTDKAVALQYLVENGCEFTVPLATPVTYQLTSQQVNALLGTMNVWADCGNVSIAYIKEGDVA